MKVKDMNFQQGQVAENSENTLPKKRCKITKIHLTEDELTNLRDTCPNDLMNLIIKHEWMKGLYTNDMEQNARLMIVRFFFNRKKTIVKCEQLVDKVGQTKLL